MAHLAARRPRAPAPDKPSRRRGEKRDGIHDQRSPLRCLCEHVKLLGHAARDTKNLMPPTPECSPCFERSDPLGRQAIENGRRELI
jgi:hypothetical protein